MIMKDAFEALKPPDNRPPVGLKEEVFTSLRTMQLIADMIDLFTSQFILSESEMVNLFDSDFYNTPDKLEDEEDDNPEDDKNEKK